MEGIRSALAVVILLNIFTLGIKFYRALFLQIRESPYIEAARAYEVLAIVSAQRSRPREAFRQLAKATEIQNGTGDWQAPLIFKRSKGIALWLSGAWKAAEPVLLESVEEMLAKVRELVQTAQPGSPVYVRMADEWFDQFAKLTAKDLDALAPRNPLMLCFSGSEGAVNTAMLERAFAAGLPRDHFGVVKDASGQPTGQLFGAAQGIVGWNLREWPELTEDIFRQQEAINNDFLRVGVTTVTGHASGYTVTIMSQLFHQGRLKLRIRPDLDFARENPLVEQFLRRTPNLVNFALGDDMIRIAGAAIGPGGRPGYR